MKYSAFSFFLFFFFLTTVVDAQVRLSMDKFGKRKSLDFYEGETITVRMKGEKGFHQLYIQKLYPEAKLIQTQLGAIHLDQIERVRIFKTKKLAKALKFKFWIFGTAWGFYSVIGALFLGEPWMWGTLIVVGAAFLLGWLFGFIFKHRTFKIGKKRKLRIQDISFGKPKIETS